MYNISSWLEACKDDTEKDDEAEGLEEGEIYLSDTPEQQSDIEVSIFTCIFTCSGSWTFVYDFRLG